MHRYLIERTFPDGLHLPDGAEGSAVRRRVVEANSAESVTWVGSYVSSDRRRTYCVYDGPSPEAIRRAAAATDLPVDAITEVSVLDPYAYPGGAP